MNKKLRAYLPSITLFTACIGLFVYSDMLSQRNPIMNRIAWYLAILCSSSGGALLPRSKEFKEKRKQEEFYWFIIVVTLIVAFVAGSLIDVYR